jgi:hypothetical protein
VEKLNSAIHLLDKAGVAQATQRCLNDLTTLRRFVTRIGVISRTGFLASGYALLDVLVSAVLILITVAAYKTEFGVLGRYLVIAFITLMYSYLWRLIRDLDDPFEYAPDGRVPGASEIELFPLLEYQARSRARLERQLQTPWTPPAPKADPPAPPAPTVQVVKPAPTPAVALASASAAPVAAAPASAASTLRPTPSQPRTVARATIVPASKNTAARPAGRSVMTIAGDVVLFPVSIVLMTIMAPLNWISGSNRRR